jgi:SAM-dependent methyltransferase
MNTSSETRAGTGEIEGELWGARARDWARIQEPAWNPVYESVLEALGLRRGRTLLDVGCGAGSALVLANGRGAIVTGLDASDALVSIARTRLPGARIEVGDMENLPFADRSFDVVTSFNAFQFAGDMRNALSEARRVCADEGHVAMLVWGPRSACDLPRSVLPAVFGLVPPARPPAAGTVPLSEPGAIEAQMVAVGMTPAIGGDVDCDFTYADVDTACRAIASAGAVVRVSRAAGEGQVFEAIAGALRPFTRSDGCVVLRNRFRWVAGTPRGADRGTPRRNQA